MIPRPPQLCPRCLHPPPRFFWAGTPRRLGMQLWTGRGSRSLLGAFRSISKPTERRFTTTPILERSKKKQNAKVNREQFPLDSKSTAKPKPSSSFTKTGRPSLAAGTRDFPRAVELAVRELEDRLYTSGESLEGWDRFARMVQNACKADESKASEKWRLLKASLRTAYLSSGLQGLKDELAFLLQSENITAKFSIPHLEAQRKVADLRYPAEWYPSARSIQRNIHLHVGPTNSGKTYHALKRLEGCKNGFYAGPLRLLAQEVYHRFKGNGIPCSLVTGDEVKAPENGELPRVVSNTVEMVSLGQEYDVGVIDEIQMIANSTRGWAWTRAVLGARVSELHLCGEARTVPLIRELCALTGDNLEIHRYERLNPLEVMPHSLRGNLNNLQKGDCLVAFSRVGIHALKGDIEKTTGKRAAIVYGGLPAEIRTQQANLFNDPDNDYDFLVASDAIGMGLNLSCKRVIFETLIKRLPGGLQRLTVPEIKQIGGRAGRYRPAGATTGTDDGTNVGLVTSLEEVDLPYIQQAMGVEPPPLRAAGIFPPDFTILNFAGYFPKGIPLEYLNKRILELAQTSSLFFFCDPESQQRNLQVVDTVEGLRLQDSLTFMRSPMETKDAASREVTCALADCVAFHERGRLLEIPNLNLEVLQRPVSGNKEYMHELESLHKAIILYSWLSFRFGGVFTDRTLASHVKELVEERLMRALTEFSSNKKLRKDASLKRQIALQKQMLEQERVMAHENPNTADGEEIQTPVDLSEGSPESSIEGLDPLENAPALETNNPSDEGSAEESSGLHSSG